MLKKLKKFNIISLISLIMLLINQIPVAADTYQLPSTLEIAKAQVFRNLVSDGDWLVVYEYNIQFGAADWPSATYNVNNTFTFRMMDNTRQISSSQPYPYFQIVPGVSGYGYGHGVGSFYLSAEEASASQLVWDHPYSIRIDTNPMYFTATSTYVSYNLTASNYTEDDKQSQNQDALQSYIVETLAPDLTNEWAVVLVTDGILNSVGQSYFERTIPGLSTFAPKLYSLSITNPTLSNKIGTALADIWENRWEGTDFEQNVLMKLEDKFNISWSFVTTCIMLIIWAIFAAYGAIKWGNTDPGFYSGCVLFGVSATMGLFDVTTAAVISFLLILYVGYIFFGRTN